MKKKLWILLSITLIFASISFTAKASSECPHEWEVTFYRKPTCGNDGYQDKTCKLCNAYITEDIPATGNHDWGAWDIYIEPDCSEPGRKDRLCRICNKRETVDIPPTGQHAFKKWQIDKKATVSSNGLKSRYCSVCYYEETKVIPKIKVSKNGKKIVNTINTFYSAARKYNVSKMRSCFLDKKKVKVFEEFKEMAKFCRKYNKKIKHEVLSVKINGTKATAKVRCSYQDAYFAIAKAMEDNMYYFLYYPNATGDEFRKTVYKDILFYLRFDNTEMFENEATITFELCKKGKFWKIKKPTMKIYDSIHCGYESAFRTVFD